MYEFAEDVENLRKFLYKLLAGIYKKQTRQLDKSEAAGNQRCKDKDYFRIIQFFRRFDKKSVKSYGEF